jgi:hypothetical protein
MLARMQVLEVRPFLDRDQTGASERIAAALGEPVRSSRSANVAPLPP